MYEGGGGGRGLSGWCRPGRRGGGRGYASRRRGATRSARHGRRARRRLRGRGRGWRRRKTSGGDCILRAMIATLLASVIAIKAGTLIDGHADGPRHNQTILI